MEIDLPKSLQTIQPGSLKRPHEHNLWRLRHMLAVWIVQRLANRISGTVWQYFYKLRKAGRRKKT